MVDVASEVLLSRHAEVTSLVQAIGFVISWTDHIWSLSCDGRELIKEVIENGFVCLVRLSISGVAVDESALGLLQPGIGVCEVTGCLR